MFSDGTSFLDVTEGSTGIYYSKLTAAAASGDNAGDASYAALSYTGDASGATGFYAVGPISQESGASVTAGADSFNTTLTMPNEFTQTASEDPGFLSPYMYMYGSTAIEDGACAVDFQHVPAVLRFIITNGRPYNAVITSVSVSVSDGSAVASDTVVLSGTPGSEVTQTLSDSSQNGTNSTVTTMLMLDEEEANLSAGSQYIAYALVLPLDSEEAFKDKTINFTIKTTDSYSENEYLAYKLDTELLAGANALYGGAYNWVGGKSYTFRISLDDVIQIDEVTVTDWDETDIDGGIAEKVTEIPTLTDATYQGTTSATTNSNGVLQGTEDTPIQIGVTVKSGTHQADNVKWTNASYYWDYSDTMLRDTTADISAYYPYSKSGIIDCSPVNGVDLLYHSDTYSSNRVSLNMEHKLAKLVVKVTGFGSEITNNPTVTKVEISGIYTTASFDGKTGVLTTTGDPTGAICSNVSEILLIPMDAKDVTLTFQMDDGSYYRTTVALPKVEAGKQYNVQVQVGGDKVSVTVDPTSLNNSDYPFSDGWNNEEDLDTVASGDTEDSGKLAWENYDQIIVTLTSQNFGPQTCVLTYHSGIWTLEDEDYLFEYLKGETPTVSAVYAPSSTPGMGEYISAACKITDGKINISFEGVARNYSRLRIVGAPYQTLSVTTTEFTPAGTTEVPTEPYTLTTDEWGNAYLYGTFAEGANVSVTKGDVTLKGYTFTAEKHSNGTEPSKSYVLDARPIIDGTLGGKATATEDEVNALVEKLKKYVDNGITTIIVTGEAPAMIEVEGYTISAIGAAIYKLSGSGVEENSTYLGKIDLILSDVTEIVALEFFRAYALNSITLPKVTTVGDGAFYDCPYLKQITFGSVVTSIAQSDSSAFYDAFDAVGSKTENGLCDLVLSCGQVKEANDYQPNIETKKWWGIDWNSIALSHTYAEGYIDNGDGTHYLAHCACGESREADEKHTFDSTDGKCSLCGSNMAAASVTTAAGATTYYADLQSAIDAAEKSSGCTLTLQNNVTSENGFVLYAGNFTLDLNGKTIEVSGEEKALLQVYSGSLVIQDSSAGASGRIWQSDGYRTLDISGGAVELESGSLDNTNTTMSLDSCVAISDGTFTQSGGTVTGDLYISGGTLDFSKLTTPIGNMIYVAVNMSNPYEFIRLPEGYALYDGSTLVGSGENVTVAANSWLTIAECTHSGAYSLSEDKTTITEACMVCGSELGTVSISVAGRVDVGDGTLGIIYDGEAYEATVTKNGTFGSQTFTVAYAVKDGTELNSAPVNAGTYTASITVGEGDNAKTASVEFTIEKATPTYTVPTGLTATYGDTLEKVTLPSGFAWADATTTSVGNAGNNTFKVTYTPADTTNYLVVENIEVTIAVAKATPEVTDPVAASNLTYNGAAQNLVTEGSTTGGTLMYGVGEGTDANADNVTYSESLPTATDAGTYTVYYKVAGDDNYNEVTAKSVEVTIGTKQLTAITKPVNVTLSKYYTDAADSIAELSSTVTYTAEDGEVAVEIEWVCEGYNPAVEKTNTFTWKVKENALANYDVNGLATTGTITVTNAAALEVNHVGTDKEIAYDGSSYNLTGLFTFGTTTGTASYAIMEGSTGTGTIENGNLTITKVGIFEIKLTTAADGAYAAGEKAATLTVTKGVPDYTVPANLMATYGQTLADVALPQGWAWNVSGTSVGDAGSKTFKATYTPENTGLYQTVEENVSVEVAPKSLSGATVSPDANADVTYTGTAKEPAVVVMLDSASLDAADYDVSYTNNINVGTATVTVTGKGNYTGSAEGSFEIKYLETTAAATAPTGWGKAATITAPTGYTISESLTGTYGASITVSETSADLETGTAVTYYLKQDGTGYITDAKTITVYVDATAPEVESVTVGSFTSTTAELSWLVSDNRGIITDCRYEVSTGSNQPTAEEVLANGTDVTGEDGGYNLSLEGLTADTTYTLYVAAKDEVGNIGLGSVTFTTKKAGYTAASLDKKYYYAKDHTESFGVSGYVPSDAENVTYGITDRSGDDIFGTVPAVSASGEVSYTVKAGKATTASSFKVAIKSDTYDTIDVMVVVTLVDQKPVSLKAGTAVTVTNSITYGAKLSDLVFGTAVFVDEDGTIVPGTLSWQDGSVVPSAATTSATWVFTPDNEEYMSCDGTADITVKQATPAVSAAPTVAERTYHPTKALTDSDLTGGSVTGVDGVALSGTWSWQTTGTVPKVENSGYVAVFTPEDSTNYESVTRTIPVTVAKATPVVAVVPGASAITYGDALSASVLTGGTAQYSSADTTAVAGTFAWKDGTGKPVVADSNSTMYEIVFTPADAANYNSVLTKSTVTVNKAQNAPNMPAGTMSASYQKTTVGAVTLPTGWAWAEEDAAKELTVGEAVTATAIYTGADADNYETVTVSVTITRSACSHTGGTATCTEKAVCTACGEAYGTVDSSNHGAEEIRNAVSATCIADGYTGDTYCEDCGSLVAFGSTIPMESHYDTNTDGRCDACGYVMATPTPTPAATPTPTPGSTPTATPAPAYRPETSWVTPETEALYKEAQKQYDVLLGTSAKDVSLVKTMEVGGTVDLNFYGVKNWKKDAYTYKWTSSDESIAVVDSVGKVTMLDEGIAIIRLELTYKATGKRLNVAPVLVGVPEAVYDVFLGTSAKDVPLNRELLPGEKLDLNFYGVKNWKKDDYEYEWLSANEEVATVNEVGLVTAKTPGMTIIRLKLKNKATGEYLVVAPVVLTVPEKTEE